MPGDVGRLLMPRQLSEFSFARGPKEKKREKIKILLLRNEQGGKKELRAPKMGLFLHS